MFSCFKDIISYIQNNNIKKTAAIAAAHDKNTLISAIEARELGIMDFVLIGDGLKIEKILADLGQKSENWPIIDEKNDNEAAKMAAKMTCDKKVDLPMKGILHTSTFMRAILDKSLGLIDEKAQLSVVNIFFHPIENRMMLVSDCVMSIAPDYNEKVKIINNAVQTAHKLGFNNPRVAVLAAVEEVNPSMKTTVDAAMLSKACNRGQIKDCIVDGPLALDNAVSKAAMEVKGIHSPLDGQADILIMPNLEAGNIFIKSLQYFAGITIASATVGANVPIVATSRTSSLTNKINTMAISIL